MSILTPREQQIVDSLVRGATVCEVAMELGLRPSTVRTHIRSVYRKTDVSNRVELLRWVLLTKGVIHSED